MRCVQLVGGNASACRLPTHFAAAAAPRLEPLLPKSEGNVLHRSAQSCWVVSLNPCLAQCPFAQVKDILAFTVTVSCQDNADACSRVRNETTTLAWKLKQVGAGGGGSPAHVLWGRCSPRRAPCWGACSQADCPFLLCFDLRVSTTLVRAAMGRVKGVPGAFASACTAPPHFLLKAPRHTSALHAGHPPGFAPILSLSAISSYVCETLLGTLSAVEQVRFMQSLASTRGSPAFEQDAPGLAHVPLRLRIQPVHLHSTPLPVLQAAKKYYDVSTYAFWALRSQQGS